MAGLPPTTALVAVGLIEKDNNKEVGFNWMYPSIEEDLEKVLISRSNLAEDNIEVPFVFSKYKGEWHYILTVATENSEKLPRISAFSICLITKVFSPEKYAILCKLLASLYLSSGSPLTLLEAYLSIITTNEYNGGEAGSYNDGDIDVRKSLLVTSIKDVIRMFGIEIILIWSAILMKKRVVVYSEKLSILLRVIRALPLLVLHRQDWGVLRPYVKLDSEVELEELKVANVYCAGFTDSAIKNHEELYDVFVDVNARTVSVASHAKADFMMGAFHKEIATLLVEGSENPDLSDQELLKALTAKTRDMLGKLAQLKVADQDGNSYITFDSLQQRRLPPHMDRFLFNIASAEGMAKSSR